MATTERVVLRPGDCLLCAATLLHGVAEEPEVALDVEVVQTLRGGSVLFPWFSMQSILSSV